MSRRKGEASLPFSTYPISYGDLLRVELLLANAGKVRRTNLNGREYLVAPMTLIVHGVLNGSKGSLYYPLQEISKEPGIWNHIPIVVYHPIVNGENVSAKDPGVLDRSGIGILRNSKIDNDRLRAEGWFDVERTRRIDPRVLNALENNRSIELSTGLYTENEPAPMGANYKGVGYEFIARNYKPDHLAILPDQIGACGIRDGCGVLVNTQNTSESNSTRVYRTASGKVLLQIHNSNPEGCNQYKGCGEGGDNGSDRKAGASAKREEYKAKVEKVKETISPEHAQAVHDTIRELGGHVRSKLSGITKGVDENDLLDGIRKKGVDIGPTGLKGYKLLDKMQFVGWLGKGETGGDLLSPKVVRYHLPMSDNGLALNSPQDISLSVVGLPPTFARGDMVGDMSVSPVELSSNSTRLERFIHWLIGNVSVENCGGKGGKPGPCPSGRKAYVPHPRQPGAPKPETVKPPRAKGVKPPTAPTPKPPTPTAKTPTKTTPVPKTPKPPVSPPIPVPTPKPSPTPPPSAKVPTPTKGKPSKSGEPQPVKPNSKLLKSTVDDVHGHITDLLKNPDKITAKHVEETASKLMSLSAKDMRGLGDKLGITGLKGSDLKAKLAEKISKGSLEGKSGSKGTDKEQGSSKTPTEPTKQPDKQPKATKPPTQETPKPSADTKSGIKEAGVAGSGKVSSRDDFAHELMQHLDKMGVHKDDTDTTNKKVAELLDKYSKPIGKITPEFVSKPENMKELELEGAKFRYSEKSKGDASNFIRQLLDKNTIPKRLFEALQDVTISSHEVTQNMADGTRLNVKGSSLPNGSIALYKGGADIDTMTHEAGHNLATQKWSSSVPPYESEYGRAQEKEKPVSWYGSTGPHEDFADAVMMYSKDKDGFGKKFPEKHRAIEKILSESKEHHQKERKERYEKAYKEEFGDDEGIDYER